MPDIHSALRAQIDQGLPEGSISGLKQQHFTEDVPDLIAEVQRLRRALEWAAALDARESTEGEIRNAIKRARAALAEQRS